MAEVWSTLRPLTLAEVCLIHAELDSRCDASVLRFFSQQLLPPMLLPGHPSVAMSLAWKNAESARRLSARCPRSVSSIHPYLRVLDILSKTHSFWAASFRCWSSLSIELVSPLVGRLVTRYPDILTTLSPLHIVRQPLRYLRPIVGASPSTWRLW